MPTWPFEFFGNNAGGGGGGGTSYINSIQTFEITIAASSTSNIATITSVNTGNAVIFFAGFTSAETSVTYQDFLSRAELTNATTVTVYRNTSTTNSITVRGTVVEFTSAAIASVQAGTITIPSGTASATATISSVNTSNSVVFYLGFTASGAGISSLNYFTSLTLTNATTVTASRNAAPSGITTTVGYCVVNFASGITNSIQQRSVTLSSSTTSDTDTISSINTGNAILIYGGGTTSATAVATFLYNLQLTNSTTVTLSRGGTNAGSRTVNYTVLEFAGGVLNSLQRGTLAMTNATSADATITSVNTAKTVCNWTGLSSNLSSNAPNECFSTVKLLSATDVRAEVNTAASGITATPGYEVVEFK